MSQRGPVSRPASPVSARSSTPGHRTSPTSLHSGLRGGGDPPSDDGSQGSFSIPSTNGEQTHSIQRSLGVHNILNPSDTHSAPQSAGSSILHRRPESASPSTSQVGHYETSPSQRHVTFQGHGLVQQQQGTSRLSSDSSSLLTSTGGRASPSMNHPWPPITGPRRYLTPKSPKARSLSHGAPRQVVPQQSQIPPPVPLGPHRPYMGDGGGSDRSPHIGPGQPMAPPINRLNLPGVSAHSPMPSFTTIPRSSSQPLSTNSQPAAHEQPIQGQANPFQAQRPSNFPSPTGGYSPSMPPASRGFPPLASGDPRWSAPAGLPAVQQGPGIVSSVPVTEGHLILAPPGLDAIPVVVDRHNASRQADEKRLRNAGASARFRQRKKDKDQQKDSLIAKLEAQNRELEKRMREIESERNRYRADRDRLRDVVYRTPGISELAFQGPQSPSQKSVESMAEQSPLVPPPPPISIGSYGVGDSQLSERPSRRRRTDPHVEFSSGSYIGALPPPVAYGTPLSQPGTPGMGRSERLPPLRIDQPMSTPLTTSEPSSANTPAQSYSPFRREPYESGWATKPSSTDPGLR
ncbi:hypothetical protein BX600DRAFT_515681 [Xylariales sp. PMI_506]|nr:hypothetical protein BX600DRAFT_515681 [Xylariales sp. PMI_506]